MEHDSLIELMCKQGEGGNHSYTIKLYRVLDFLTIIIKSGIFVKIIVRCGIAHFLKDKYIVLACMVEEDNVFGDYEYALVGDSNEWRAHSIYVLKDACCILSVRKTLHNK